MIRQKIKNLLDRDVIRQSKSPRASQVLCVRKRWNAQTLRRLTRVEEPLGNR